MSAPIEVTTQDIIDVLPVQALTLVNCSWVAQQLNERLKRPAHQHPASPVAPAPPEQERLAERSAEDDDSRTGLLAKVAGLRERVKDLERFIEGLNLDAALRKAHGLAPVATGETGQLDVDEFVQKVVKHWHDNPTCSLGDGIRSVLIAWKAKHLAAQPAGTQEQVRELIARWRTTAANYNYSLGREVWGFCADELEKTLSAAAPQSQQREGD